MRFVLEIVAATAVIAIVASMLWWNAPNGNEATANVLGMNGKQCIVEIEGERRVTENYCLYLVGENVTLHQTNWGSWRVE